MGVTSTISPLLKFGLRILGVWPDVPYATVRRLIHLSSILIVQYFQYVFVFAHFKLSKLQYLIDSIPATLYYTLTIMKMIALWKYHRVVREVLADMDSDWRECVKVDQHLHLMRAKASISSFCTYVLLGFNTIAIVFYFGTDNIIAFFHLVETDNGTSRPFPVSVLLPFNAEQSPIYEVLVVILFLHSALVSYTVAFLNSLISTLVFHVSGQIDILRMQLKNISKKMLYYESAVYKTGMLVEKHNKIISFSESLDKLFSFIALLQVFCNTLVICFLGLVFITSHTGIGANLLKAVFGYIGITVEIFIFCFVGEYLCFKCTSLGDAAYESLWYNMPSSHGKNILFIIMRSQKQQTITVGGITNLTLEAFTTIMKTSASYMSILNAMY